MREGDLNSSLMTGSGEVYAINYTTNGQETEGNAMFGICQNKKGRGTVNHSKKRRFKKKKYKAGENGGLELQSEQVRQINHRGKKKSEERRQAFKNDTSLNLNDQQPNCDLVHTKMGMEALSGVPDSESSGSDSLEYDYEDDSLSSINFIDKQISEIIKPIKVA